jgi:YihY family inner membrane protein
MRIPGRKARRSRPWVPWRWPWTVAFWNRAYKENITGLSGMVAYNLVLAVFPFALLVLFVVGQVLRSETAETSVLADVQRLLPNVEPEAIENTLDRIRSSSTTIGIAAALGGIWISASFWGALDTAFCRIYHVDCRGWVEQKRFSLVMLLVVMLFIAASLAVPTIESAIYSTTDDLPWGLSNTNAVAKGVLVVAGLVVTFMIASVIYWAVPKGHMPWPSVWPGALFFATVTGIGNFAFPLYLREADLDRIGGTLGLILIILIWFYLVSLALLAGAVINSLFHERDDTGRLPIEG